MKYRKFGSMEFQISEIGFGAWGLGGQWGQQEDSESMEALKTAMELGVNFIDTAQAYGDGRSEEVIGNVLHERVPDADRIMVATKIPPTDGHWPPYPDDVCEERYPRDYLRKGVETSLKRLKTGAIDLLQLHTWTSAWNENPVCLQYLDELKKEGKILAYGISTPENDQNSLVDLMKQGLLDTVQVIYNIFDQEAAASFLGTARKHGVGVIVRCALDEGSLTGKFTESTIFGEEDFRRHFFKGNRLKETIRRVTEIKKTVARHPDVDPDNLASVAVRFVLKHPAVSTVITGIRNASQARRNCAIINDPELPEALYKELKEHNWRRYFWEWSNVY